MRIWPALVIFLLACEGPTPSLPPRKAPPSSELGALAFLEHYPVSVSAGSTRQFRLFDRTRHEPAQGVRIAWSVKPSDRRVTIDNDGVLTVDASTPEGANYEIVAEVDRGARVLEQRVTIFHPGNNPLLDSWRETGEIGCDGVVRQPSDPAPTLRFFADDTFLYDRSNLPPDARPEPQGRYSFDTSKKTITLIVGDVVTKGTYELTRVGPRKLVPWISAYEQPSKLVLRATSFETWSRADRPKPCGLEFRASPFVH